MYIGSSCFSEPSAPTLSPFDTTLFIVTTLAFGLQGGACFRMYVCVCTQVWKSQDIIPLRILIALLCSKHCSAGLLLRVG